MPARPCSTCSAFTNPTSALVPLEPARPGDHFTLELVGVGGATITFA
jgi:hypothetical protein